MNLPIFARTFLLSVLFFSSGMLQAQNPPKGFFLDEGSLSPDGRYGVLAPITAEQSESAQPKNSLIEVKSGRVLAVIEAETAWDHRNHRSILPSRWSPDGSLLLWEVEGKWFPDALVFLKLEKGKVLWQCNVLRAGQQAILAQTKKAMPEKFAQAKKAVAGSGSAYPEGFSIDVEVIGAVALPLRVMVNLTSNPKGIEDAYTLETHLEGSVDSDGIFSAKSFKAGPSPSHHF